VAPAQPTAPQPTLGSILGNLLWEGAKKLVKNAIENRLQQSQAPIQPGMWDIRLRTPANPRTPGPVLVGGRVQLAPGGNMEGVGELVTRGYTQPCQLAGRWHYDLGANVFSVQGMINGMPPYFEQRMQLTGGMNGQLFGTGLDGTEFVFTRLA
jgi:hypothetical protein